MPIKASELILNEDGSIYHLSLKPQDIGSTIILVGDQNRVEMVSSHFDTLRFKHQNREFKTHTGTYNEKEISVISTGIGTDNIDIVLNELDALLNIDFNTRKVNQILKSLNIIRIGTSGAIQKNIPIDSFLISSAALDITGMLHAYKTELISNLEIEKAFINFTNWNLSRSKPLYISASKYLISKFKSSKTLSGITITSNGFYGPQGRVLRLKLQDSKLNQHIENFSFNGNTISNYEMETAGIYGLSRLLGHNAISLNAIIANRPDGTFSKNPQKTIENLISYTLERL